MAGRYHPQYNNTDHQHQQYYDGGGDNSYTHVPDTSTTTYSYPPRHDNDIDNQGEKQLYYEHGQHDQVPPVQRQYSYADSDDASTRVGSSSIYDEKKGSSSSTAALPVNNNNNNGMGEYYDGQQHQGLATHPGAYDNNQEGEEEYLPPAIPRTPTSDNPNFKPGHISRGSVALLAAAEGKIPKKEGLKMWRTEEHHGTFTAGGKRRTALRCCCCTLIFAFILIVGIIAAFLLWVRPPNVQFEGITYPQGQTEALNLTSSGFNLNFDLDIAVSNPNFFGASFTKIEAKAFYPTNPTQSVGGGIMRDVKIPAHSHNKLYFPFGLNYTKSIDPNSAILLDIATKCGFVGDAGAQDINVNYDLTLSLKIAGITISPTFRSSTSFACPLTAQDVQSLLGSALGSLTSGGS